MIVRIICTLMAALLTSSLAADVEKYELTGSATNWFGIPNKSAEVVSALSGATTFTATMEIDYDAPLTTFSASGTSYNSALVSLNINFSNGETAGVNVVTPGRINLTNTSSYHIVYGELYESTYSYSGTLANLSQNDIVNISYRFQDNSASTFDSPPPNSIPDLDSFPGVKSFEIIFVGEGNTNYVKYNIGSVARVINETNFTCVGFQPPMANFPVRAKKNRVFPLKIELLDVDGYGLMLEDLSSPPVAQVMFTPDAGVHAIDVSEYALSAGEGSDGNQFVFTDDGFWQFNLQSKNYTASGEYLITAVSGDESEYTINPACVSSFVVE